MSNLTLDQLMAGINEDGSLEKEASDASTEVTTDEGAELSAGDALAEALQKQAAEKDSKEDDKDDSKDKKEESKKDSKDEKKPKQSDEEKPEMNKEAQDKGVAMADAIIANLTKQANEIQAQSDSLVKEQDSETERTPKGKVNEVLTAIQARGKSNGAVDTGSQDPAAESASEGNDCGEKPEASSDIEKAAAVSHLVNEEGHSYEDAVNLVKEASEAIDAEQNEHMKVAAVNALMEQGIGIEEAVEAVKAHLAADSE